MSRSSSSQTLEVQALVLGRVNFREADVILQLFTDGLGRLSALARSARRSKKRFNGALEPMHTLRVEISDKARGDLHTMKDAQIVSPRTKLASSLDGLTTAGTALNWVKKAAPQHTAEPELWRAITLLLDQLNQPLGDEGPNGLLAGFGLRLLEVQGWGLHLVSCVSCSKPCPAHRAAWIHPERGGIICRECGGGPIRLSGEVRGQMIAAGQNDGVKIGGDTSVDVLRVIDRSLGAHMGLDRASAGDLGRRLK